MTNLTEQWKKGELEQGYYYMQIPTGDIRIITECMKVDCKGFSILSKVPSYEEWQKVLNIDFNNEVLRLENAKLKELLRKCRSDLISCFAVGYEDSEFIKKINEVLK